MINSPNPVAIPDRVQPLSHRRASDEDEIMQSEMDVIPSYFRKFEAAPILDRCVHSLSEILSNNIPLHRRRAVPFAQVAPSVQSGRLSDGPQATVRARCYVEIPHTDARPGRSLATSELGGDHTWALFR